jgi:adenosylmethionine-8-amino-7-oxononanoate aminotransferase
MNHVFHRVCGAEMPTATAGDGCYIIDKTGKRYLDGSGGAAVSCLGHSETAVSDAIKAQLDRIAFAHTGFFTSEPAEALADLLISHAPAGIERVYFVSGGIGSRRGSAQTRPAVFPRNRRGKTPPRHRAAPELSRQHAWRIGRGRQ